jgi:SAM-dependent methyltransferase
MSLDNFQTEILEVSRSAHNYRKWLSKLTFPYLGDNPLELGAGLGDFAGEWLTMGASNLTLSENSPSRVTALTQLYRNDDRVKVRSLNVEEQPESWGTNYSCVISLNVLEHIEDDMTTMKSAHRALRIGGVFVAFVPASDFLFSEFDELIGHHRRYSKSLLRKRMIDAGFQIEKLKYINLPGWFAWLFGMRLLRLSPKDGVLLAVWDRIVIKVAMRVERFITPPFGQSLLVVGKKVTE